MSERKAYRLSNGEYRRTQAEAKDSGHSFEQVAIPVDSHGLIDFLNGLIADERDTAVNSSPPPEQEERSGDPQPEPAPPSPAPSAPAAPPPLTLTDVEEFIQGADAVRLASITQNACYRMAEIAKGLRP